jgi:3-phenylpropionate/trans-cinnamate dioxygenase ferredoxin reductase component
VSAVRHIVVIGTGAAGLTAAEALRRAGYAGEITMVGAEAHPPYDRPPLSKQVLTGAWEPERTYLRRPPMLDKLAADWHLGVRAVALDVGDRVVTLSNDSQLRFQGLVIATGVSARRFGLGHDLSGVHVLRTIDDAIAIRSDLTRSRRLVIVGAGLVGCEVAAAARQLGIQVSLVDPLPAPMLRQVGPVVGGLIAAMHRRHGVALHLGVGIDGFEGDRRRVTGIRLRDGSLLLADTVVVAVGSVPNTQWLSGSGLTVGNGVECDEFCRAAPGIVAAGDMASWYHKGLGQRLRVEHRTNAAEQGAAAAQALLDDDAAPFAPVPYFWTDQYDVKIQMHGWPDDHDEAQVILGTPADGRFALAYGQAGHRSAVLTWNMPREAVTLRAELISSHQCDSPCTCRGTQAHRC